MTMDPTLPDQPAQPTASEPPTESEVAPAADEVAEAEPVPPAAVDAPVAAVAAPVAAAAPPLAAPIVAAAATPPAAPPAAWQAPPEPAGPFPGLKFADHGKRLVSYILDVIFAGLLTTAVAIALIVLIGVFVALGLGFLAALTGISLVIAVVAVSLIYWPYFWVKSGQTPGMKIAGGLRVVRDKDGGPITIGPAILRLIGYWIDGLVFYLGFIWILIDSRRRGWHDLIAGTVVVQDE